MKFRIHYDDIDSIDIEEETIEEVRTIAHKEAEKRGWDESKCWSEKIK